jgi:prevent-host-death family protein
MQTVNIHEAKTHLSRLLEAVEHGEEIIIARAGQPIATLTAYKPARKKIAPPGSLAGMGFWMADDFNDPIDDLFDVLNVDDDEQERSSSAPDRHA